jgi:hypothetical protein
MRYLIIAVATLLSLGTAKADTSRCLRVRSGVTEALTLSLKIPSRDPKRFVDAVDQQLSRRAITRADVSRCDPEMNLVLQQFEKCARDNDQECKVTKQDADDFDKVRDSHDNAEALLAAYKRYAVVKYCNQTRQGYVAVYVNDIELDRARTAVKAIEDKVVAADKDLNTDTLWKRALSELNGVDISRDQCQLSLHELNRQYNGIRPPDSILPKDFGN